MPQRRIRRALISVYDKTGIVDFARALVNEFGIEIISTGGTASLLKENGIPVTLVEEVTGFPEMLDGRVKTLHPKIHAAILADRDNPEHMRQLKEQGIEPIDMVVVNLYPFEKTVAEPNCTFEQAIEMIDIGGPCLLRAAAKNHKHVVVVSNVDEHLEFDYEVLYEKVLYYIREYDRSIPGDDLHPRFAKRAFWTTSCYDDEVHNWLQEHDVEPPVRRLIYTEGDDLRYGENPHQHAKLASWLGSTRVEADLLAAGVLMNNESELSFNNYSDAHSALELCKEMSNAHFGRGKVCLFIKHTNPCGVGIAADAIDAYPSAYLGDPNAAMGGIFACNFEVDATFASTVMETYPKWGKEAGASGFFVEVWITPAITQDALRIIRTSKPWGQRVRLLAVGDMTVAPNPSTLEYKSIVGGMLIQSRDLIGLKEDQWKVVTKRVPSESEISDMRLAWLIAKHTKSNAVSICKDGMLIGNGAGQMSRVMSCRIATWLASENGHAEQLPGSVAASDAFFPFSDGPNLLMDAGVTAIIQPGGSKRDAEVIAACDARNVAMIFTGTRHFRH